MRRATFHRFNKFANDPLTFSSSWSRAEHALKNILHLLPPRNSARFRKLARSKTICPREEGRGVNLFIINDGILNEYTSEKRGGGCSRNILEISSNQFEGNSLRTLDESLEKWKWRVRRETPPLWKEIGNAAGEVCDPRVIARQLCEKLSTPTWVFLSLPLHSPAPALFILPRWILLMDPLFHWFHLPFISNSLFWSPSTQISSNLSHTVKWIKDNFNYSYNVNFSISFPPPPWNPIQFQRIFREEGKEEIETDST